MTPGQPGSGCSEGRTNVLALQLVAMGPEVSPRAWGAWPLDDSAIGGRGATWCVSYSATKVSVVKWRITSHMRASFGAAWFLLLVVPRGHTHNLSQRVSVPAKANIGISWVARTPLDQIHGIPGCAGPAAVSNWLTG